MTDHLNLRCLDVDAGDKPQPGRHAPSLGDRVEARYNKNLTLSTFIYQDIFVLSISSRGRYADNTVKHMGTIAALNEDGSVDVAFDSAAWNGWVRINQI